MAGASEITVDLHGAIDKLRLFKSDLEAYFWDRMGDAVLPERQRAQMALWMRQVSERIIDLEDVVVHLGCPVVIVRGSTAERESLRGAVHRLDRSIEGDEPAGAILRSVAAVLNAADIVCLRAAGGRPGAAARRDAARIERIARTDGSCTGVLVGRIGQPPPSGRDTQTRNVGS